MHPPRIQWGSIGPVCSVAGGLQQPLANEMVEVRKEAHNKSWFVNIVRIGSGRKSHGIRTRGDTPREILGDEFLRISRGSIGTCGGSCKVCIFKMI